MNWLSLLFIIHAISPIWPLGPNPLPGDPFIIINLQTNELYYYEEEQELLHFPVATGREKGDTPEGLYTIVTKFTDPEYSSKRIPAENPRNPLGSRWMGIDARETNGRVYGIHGTNREDSIGKHLSGGCIRMKNEDVERLFAHVPLGTKVYIYAGDEPPLTFAIQYGAVRQASQP